MDELMIAIKWQTVFDKAWFLEPYATFVKTGRMTSPDKVPARIPKDKWVKLRSVDRVRFSIN